AARERADAAAGGPARGGAGAAAAGLGRARAHGGAGLLTAVAGVVGHTADVDVDAAAGLHGGRHAHGVGVERAGGDVLELLAAVGDGIAVPVTPVLASRA